MCVLPLYSQYTASVRHKKNTAQEDIGPVSRKILCQKLILSMKKAMVNKMISELKFVSRLMTILHISQMVLDRIKC